MSNPFGKYLYEARTAKKMSLQKVADKVNCSRQYIWLIESSRYRPYAALVDTLVEVLDMDRTTAHVLNGTIRPDYYDAFVKFQDALAKATEVMGCYGEAFADALGDALGDDK